MSEEHVANGVAAPWNVPGDVIAGARETATSSAALAPRATQGQRRRQRTMVIFDPQPISGLGVSANAGRALPEFTDPVYVTSLRDAFTRIGADPPALFVAHAPPAVALRILQKLSRMDAAVPLLLLLPRPVPDEELVRLRAAGVAGLLPAQATPEELRIAIAQTYFHRDYRHPKLTPVEQFAGPAPERKPLSKRELTVLHLMAEGWTNEAIGRRLFLSTDTIRCHVRSVLSKLHAENRTHAVALGYRLGLLNCGAPDCPAHPIGGGRVEA
ncbi:response regulator transcription factor [Amycolatopsis aidingensis]|uniref:response regulator transcription factor n=1 Tax=Amycolatopsis aidingensis TaxID=2842453 RepID=UPI001C0D929A|nr:response regulator transcription factor [Amycolatopsis aidingensis]